MKMDTLNKIALAIADLFIVTLFIITFVVLMNAAPARSDAPTGDVTSPPPDWKIRVTVTEPSGNVVDTLVMINPDQTPRLWPTRDECVAFQDSDEFKATIPVLHDFIVKQGWENDAVTVECVPQQHAESF